MKKLFFLLLVTASTGATAQNVVNRISIFAGGGSQKYCGDLGNGFGARSVCWYGSVGGGITYSLNRSFDAGLTVTVGDYGYHQRKTDAAVPEVKDRCPGCIGRLELDNLSSRMTAIGLQARYKFNNGYLLKEDAFLKPYVFAGASFNYVVDRMKMDCVDAGNYTALNAGAGVKVNFCRNFSVGYNGTFGYFTTDKLDYKHGGANDMYLQHSLFLGYEFGK
jgi:hypothetical protein